MHVSHLLTLLLCAAGIANAAYIIEDTYNETNFFNAFDFFAEKDPTDGFVRFSSATTANMSALAGYADGAIFLGVDHTTMNPTGGRASVRVSSKKSYTHGLFIADLAHMPSSECGLWPAFWTVGPDWPNSGEIDVIESVNEYSTDTITMHTSEGCNLNNVGAKPGSTLSTPDCNAGNAGSGCSLNNTNTPVGSAFNSLGGGVYAMEWTSSAIKVFFFPRQSIPSDITSGKPDPTSWGLPVALFQGSGCDIDSHFKHHQIIFDTTFCGQWAGKVWSSGSCASRASTCESYVAANPAAFEQAYWMINSVEVYQPSTAAGKRKTAPVPI